MTSMGILAELEAGMAELSTPMRVYVAAGRFTEPDPDLPELAARIRTLLATIAADDAWRRFLPGYTPPSVPEICAAPEAVETHGAASSMRAAAVPCGDRNWIVCGSW
ncbi:hypothetical protein ACFYSJ_35980 [Streptomyces sp. NPDC005248]|uniref:hypothetical protein n=1 Tax=unclassified Streptomyces TaxID=2593676 RepID=UPI0036B42172